MVQINFALREVNCKVVYYGPGMSGKTTNLEIVHQKAPESNKGELTSIATEGDRTLFFDFMPLDLGTIAGMRTRFQLYTVPGQVYYNSTRKLVLQGVDGVVFVADSSASKMDENLESLENLKNNLAEYGKDIRELPIVIQWNKRDLPDALPVEQLNAKINSWGCPTFEAVAITGEGVFPTLKCLSGMVLETLNRDQREAPGAPGRPQATKLAAPAAQAAPAAPAVIAAPAPVAPVAAQPAVAAASAASPIRQGFGNTMGGSPPAPPVGVPSRAGRFGGGGGSVFDEINEQAAEQPARPAASPGLVGGENEGPWQQQQQKQKQQRRQVDASPLETSTIRTTPKSSAGDARPHLRIKQEKSVPWVAVTLGALIVIAVGIILFTTGLVSLPV